jgi:hypothetical protein
MTASIAPRPLVMAGLVPAIRPEPFVRGSLGQVQS